MAFGFFKKGEKKEKAASGSTHYFELKVKETVQETKDAISIVFEQPANQPISYKSGQFLTLIIAINDKEVRRAYSLCSSPFVDADLAVTVKRVESGLVSNWLVDNVKAGDTLKIMEPMGHFTTEFEKGRKRHLVMFAGGSGITPMLSHIKSVLTQEPESIASLIYCNRDIDSIIFKDELAKWETNYQGRLHVIHILDNAPMNWQGYSGLLNPELLKKLFERIPAWGLDKTTYLMCGPEGMMKNVETLLAQHSIPAEKIFKESFVQGTIDKAKKPAAETAFSENKVREVTIRYDGNEYKIMVEPKRTILETALDQGIDLPFSCQSGLCTACRGKALSGTVKLDEEEGLSQAERNEGYVLTCVGHPMTDDVVIEIG
ncbi:MAG: ferredoxin--NADP reductase [Cyclobacteriaceae bacterium]|nr:ferredoxin--NADP reductase [Cyclobacteriaceae bacterium]